MTLKYESEILFDLMKRDGDDTPSDVLPYESELKEKYLEQVEGAYPKLQDYRSEWLNYNLEAHLPADFPVETLSNVTEATVNNVVPYAYGSAILKGQTLVNVINYDIETSLTGINLIKDNDTITVTSQNATAWLRAYYSLNVSYDKTYIVTWDSLTYTHTGSKGEYQLIGVYGFDENGTQYVVKATTQNQTNKYLIFTIPSSSNINISTVQIRIHATTGVAEVGVTTTIKGLKIIEYQDGMENWDIPYFEGIQSVKMPVLTTTGKNLLDINTLGLIFNGSFYCTSKYYTEAKEVVLNLAPNTSYTISIDKSTYIALSVNGVNKPFVNNMTTFTTLSDGVTKIKLGASGYANVGTGTLSWIQLEQGSTATPYEPFKSNILTVNEDVTLRGIGDVQDTLDCLTGEMTQRIGEIVLNGTSEYVNNQNWGTNNDFDTDVLKFFFMTNEKINGLPVKKDGTLINDKFISETISNRPNVMKSNTECMIGGDNKHGMIQVFIKKDRLTEISPNGFRQWLSQNPITINYEITTESIKTVDLSIQDQDGNTKSIIRPIEGTMHLMTEGDTIKPLFSGEIPVEATTQNLASFIEE